ncbi:hypothetical protein SAMN05421758_102385 [Salimicrobium salexigens]|uniref:Uncharacterized protein n=1 Tax=Salimicrobium salexigens TaxID=908941 RepID=A0ABY1KPE5_9BACI|nr:hypothetical protein SAMN05421758_102385 [Salimicrobium salexigens]
MLKKIYIHILNIVGLIVLLVFNAFAYLGMNFTPSNEPLTAEYIFLASFYLIWGVFYYLQLKLNSLKNLLILIILELLIIIGWSFFWGTPYGHTLIESLFE